MHKVIVPKDSSCGLKQSGIGNCKECNIEIDEKCKCKTYYEVTFDDDPNQGN